MLGRGPGPSPQPQTGDGKSGPAASFRPEDLSALKDFSFAARLIVDGLYAGRRRSPLLDYSAEFADYRPYVAGDELRSIDWRAVARSDRLYVKQSRKETNMTGTIVVDQSASMGFAGENGVAKLRYAALLAAATGYLMLRQGDRPGFALVDEKLESFQAPVAGWSEFTQMARSLERLRAEGGSNLADGLRAASPAIARRGLLLVISDFLVEPSPLFEALALYLQRGFRVILFQILTEEELELHGDAPTRYTDPEGPGRLDASPEALRESYRRALGLHLGSLRSGALARRIPYELFPTSLPYHVALSRFLTSRSGQGLPRTRVA